MRWQKPTPVAVGLHLCEDVFVEQGTGKLTLVRLFDRVRADYFPARSRPFWVFVSLVDSLGRVTVRLVCTHGETNTDIYNFERAILFSDRLTAKNIRFFVDELRFQSPGTYFMQIYCDEVLVAERRLLVYQTEGEET